MRAKSQERHDAVNLRKNDGFSIKEISDRLGVSRSSASVWVSGIGLTPGQLAALSARSSACSILGSIRGAEVNRNRATMMRSVWREEGRKYAKKAYDSKHMMCCALYWAEGSKGRNSFEFVNSDPVMIKVMVDFLLGDPFGVPKEKFRMSINCYEDVHSIKDLELFWKRVVGFDVKTGKHRIKEPKPTTEQKGKHRRLAHGVCRILVNDTRVIQHVYGALEVYVGVKIDHVK
jgi:hypothetical protein